MKKYILSFAILLVLLIGAAIFLPYLFKDKVIAFAKSEINKHTTAEVNFDENIHINIFNAFPNLNLSVGNISIVHPTGRYENDTLFYSQKMKFSFDLLSFYKDQKYIFKTVSLDNPYLNLETTDSTNNWDITTDNLPESESQPNISFELENISISRGQVKYTDPSSNTAVWLKNIAHSSKGNYNNECFTLDATTSVSEVLLSYDKINYVNNWELKQEGNIFVDMKDQKYSLPKNTLFVNGLEASLDGSIDMEMDDILFDIKAKSKTPDLNKFLTLIPAIYTTDYDKIETKGSGILDFIYNGKYSETTFPSYSLQLTVDNGYFKYPELPLPAEDINLDLHIYSKDGNTDKAVIDIPTLHFKVAQDPFDMQLNVKDLIGNTHIHTFAKGNINLSNISKIVPLENTILNGKIKTNIELHGKLDDISSSAIDKFVANGSVITSRLVYKSDQMNEKLLVDEGMIQARNQKVTIPTLSGSIGKNDFKFSGDFDNFFSYLLSDKTLYGKAVFTSKNLNANHFISETDVESVEMTLVEIPGHINLDLTTYIQNLKYDDLEFKNFNGKINVQNKTLRLKDVSTQLLGGKVQVSGAYEYNETKPLASFDVAYSQLKLEDIFAKFKIFKVFAPLLEEVSALTTAKLSFKTELNNDMSPKLENIFMNGSMNLQNITFDHLPLLQDIDKKLGTQHFDVQKINDLLLKFNIKKGKLFASPFDLFIEDSKLTLAGISKIDGSIDYKGLLSIPSSYIKNETTILNGLTTGTPFDSFQLKPQEFVDLGIAMSGTFAKPHLKLSIKEVRNSVQQNVKTVIQYNVDKQKEIATQKATNEANRLKKEAEKKAREVKNQVEEELAKRRREAEEKLRKEADIQKSNLKEEARKRLKGLFNK